MFSVPVTPSDFVCSAASEARHIYSGNWSSQLSPHLDAMAESHKEKLKVFKDAATLFGLKKPSLDKLIADDFDSIDTAQLLTPGDIEELELTKGQQRLVQRWVETLRVPVNTPDISASDTDIASVVSDAQVQPQNDRLDGLLNDEDLWDTADDGRNTNNNGRPYLVNDFVSRVGSVENETPVFEQGGTQLLLRTARQKPAPESVSLAQWIGANSRIMIKLIRDGKLGTNNDILSYLEYVSDFGDYAQVNEISSLMVYDHEYRKKQARLDRKWGEDDLHLVNFYLQRRRDNQARFRGPSNTSTNRPPRLLDHTGIEICRNFNGGGCFRTQCAYVHACIICKQKGHSRKSHKDIQSEQHVGNSRVA